MLKLFVLVQRQSGIEIRVAIDTPMHCRIADTHEQLSDAWIDAEITDPTKVPR